MKLQVGVPQEGREVLHRLPGRSEETLDRRRGRRRRRILGGRRPDRCQRGEQEHQREAGPLKPDPPRLAMRRSRHALAPTTGRHSRLPVRRGHQQGLEGRRELRGQRREVRAQGLDVPGRDEAAQVDERPRATAVGHVDDQLTRAGTHARVLRPSRASSADLALPPAVLMVVSPLGARCPGFAGVRGVASPGVITAVRWAPSPRAPTRRTPRGPRGRAGSASRRALHG